MLIIYNNILNSFIYIITFELLKQDPHVLYLLQLLPFYVVNNGVLNNQIIFFYLWDQYFLLDKFLEIQEYCFYMQPMYSKRCIFLKFCWNIYVYICIYKYIFIIYIYLHTAWIISISIGSCSGLVSRDSNSKWIICLAAFI